MKNAVKHIFLGIGFVLFIGFYLIVALAEQAAQIDHIDQRIEAGIKAGTNARAAESRISRVCLAYIMPPPISIGSFGPLPLPRVAVGCTFYAPDSTPGETP